MAALGASVVLPFTPGLAQEAPVVTPPPVVATPPAPTSAPAPAPAPVATTPAPPARPPVSIAPLPPTATETPLAAEERPAARARTPTRAAQRPAAARPAAEAPAERVAPTPAPADPIAAEPVPLPEALEPLPEALEPLPAPPELTAPEPIEPAQPVEPPPAGRVELWIAAGAALLLAVLALFAWRRRREREEERVYVKSAHAAPVKPAPARAARPAAPAPQAGASPRHADPRDLAAMAASSQPEAGRPWLEFLMRPVRAGTDADEAVVEFELIVGNTGSVPARDVRISTWMFAAGDGASEMERSLIEPPAGAKRTTATIAPGAGAQVETAIALPKEELRGKVLPVVVADARYRLPDGSEGRTSASFAVGLPNGEGLEPFAVDLPTGLREDVEARLHGEPQRV